MNLLSKRCRGIVKRFFPCPVLFVGIYLFFIVLTDSVYGCACVETPSATGVEFVGTVVRITDLDKSGQRMIEFKVLKNIHDMSQEFVTIYTALEISDCRYDFKVKRAYLVKADWKKESLYSDRCYGNEEFFELPKIKNDQDFSESIKSEGSLFESEIIFSESEEY